MRPRPFLLLLAGFALALAAAGEADAKEPEWSYEAESSLNSIAISADGEYIAAGSNDDKVYLFDRDSSTPLWSYETGEGVPSIAISADGEYIVTGSDDDKVYLFDKDSSTPLWSYATGGWVVSVAISADGEYITAGSWDGNVYLFGKDSNTTLWSYTAGEVDSVAISADGEYIAAGADSTVYLFNKDSSNPLWSYYAEQASDVYVSVSADGEYIAAGTSKMLGGNYDYDMVYLFDKDSSTPLWSYETGDEVYSVAISADGEYIAAGTSHKVYVFDRNSSTPLWNYGRSWGLFTVTISADGEYITAGTGAWEYKEIHLFDKDSSTPLWSYETGGGVPSVAISADGKYIAGASDKVYHFENNYLPTAQIDSISPSPARFDNEEVTFSGSGSDSDGTVVAYEWTSDIDGFLSDEEDFSITGFSVGNHTISFRVQDNEGDWSFWSTAGLYIHPNAPPVATIDSITPSPARFDAEVTFSATRSDSDGTIVAYEWTSDIDGVLSDEEDFSITGFTVGNRTISFRVQDNDGAWSSWSTAELYVYPNAPPVGTIDSIEPSPAEKGDEVTFNGTGTDSDGTIVAYQWESSIDGELSTNEDFSSSDLALGHHTITFRVQDNDGVWSDSQASGENGSVPGIQLWIYAVPVAIAGDDVSTTPTVPVQFSGQGTDEDGTIAKYEWDFDGNGVYEWSSTENGRELNLYNNVGVYTAMLRVTDNDGFTDTDTVVITVTEKIVLIDDDGTVTVEEGEGGIPAPSLAAAVAAVAVIALRRRHSDKG